VQGWRSGRRWAVSGGSTTIHEGRRNSDEQTLLLDVAFFIAESEASPKHVGGLMICKRPARSKTSFAADLYREFLTFTDVQPPFNRVITFR
jgi:hypothetical protein